MQTPLASFLFVSIMYQVYLFSQYIYSPCIHILYLARHQLCIILVICESMHQYCSLSIMTIQLY